MTKHHILNIAMLWAAIATIMACGTTNKQPATEEKPVNIEFHADSAYAFCAAQCTYGPRTMNSEAHEKCGKWIASQFQKYGCSIELQCADLKGFDGTILKSTNIIASMPKRSTDKHAS